MADRKTPGYFNPMKQKLRTFGDAGSLEEIGEFGMIRMLKNLFQTEADTGIGDDCAILPYRDQQSLLVTSDMLLEGTHFQRDWISAGDLGYKSLAVNLSDIAAMGGKPAFAFLSIGLPAELPPIWLDRFFHSAKHLADQHAVSISGGDTTRSPGPLVISYTVLGFVNQNQVLRRSSAKPGDRIALLGATGESGAGLRLFKRFGTAVPDEYRELTAAHNRPRLYMEEARFLAGSGAVTSMIDLSDGMQSDAGHIADASGVSLIIETEKLPVSPLLQQACRKYEWNLNELILTDGEDYGLLFTVGESEAEKLGQLFRDTFGHSFTVIGTVEAGQPEVQFRKSGKPLQLKKTGYDHFSG